MSDQLLLDYVRGLGLACGSIHQGRHVGWTTDEAKADAARAAGASLAAYTSREPSASGRGEPRRVHVPRAVRERVGSVLPQRERDS